MAEKINLLRPSYVVYEHVDLETFKKFANDFGLEEVTASTDQDNIFFRGYGKDQFVYIARQAPAGSQPRFVGGGFCATSEEDFEKAARLEGAQLVDISKWPYVRRARPISETYDSIRRHAETLANSCPSSGAGAGVSWWCCAIRTALRCM